MNKNKLPVRFTGQHFTIDKVLIVTVLSYTQAGILTTKLPTKN
jgi:hypothetical protein